MLTLTKFPNIIFNPYFEFILESHICFRILRTFKKYFSPIVRCMWKTTFYTRASSLPGTRVCLFLTWMPFSFIPSPLVTKKSQINLQLSLYWEYYNTMSILKLKNHMKRNLILNCQSTENFLTAPLIYCNFQFPNTKIQQFLLKSIRW